MYPRGVGLFTLVVAFIGIIPTPVRAVRVSPFILDGLVVRFDPGAAVCALLELVVCLLRILRELYLCHVIEPVLFRLLSLPLFVRLRDFLVSGLTTSSRSRTSASCA